MFTLTAIKKLQARGVTVELLCIAESRIHIEANNMGVIIHPIFLSGYVNPMSTLKVGALIRKSKFDVIHTQASKDLWILVPALKMANSKVPLILTKQVGSFIVKKDALHRKLYGRLTYALAISNVIKKNLVDTTPLSSEKVLLLHNGIDIEKFNPAKLNREKIREEFKINNNELLIGMVARFSPGKGHEEFLHAADVLTQKYSHLKFMIVGEASRGEEEYENEIKKLADDYRLKNIIFTGYRSDTPDVLGAMDIFVFPSHSEAFGIALAEALAAGKPSVCSNSDGVLDIAVDGETSYLFETRNGDDLADKVELLIKSPEQRIKFGRAARARAINNFDIEKLTDKVVDIYKQASSFAGN